MTERIGITDIVCAHHEQVAAIIFMRHTNGVKHKFEKFFIIHFIIPMEPREILERLRAYEANEGKGHVPLTNIANTCFLNVVLQVLFHTIPLAEALRDPKTLDDIEEHLEDPRIEILLYFIKMNHVVWSQQTTSA